jgi:CRP-like cAMP-binding protein
LTGSAWYFIGDTYKENELNNWIQSAGIEEHSVPFRYAISLHWSLANFGLCGANVFPENSGEACYAIFMLMIGLVFLVLFVSVTTKSMVQLESSKDEMHKQLWLLRRYLNEKSVPRHLAIRTLRFLEYKVASSVEQISESRLEVLKMLSDSLSLELKYTVEYALLRKHPLIETAERHSDAVLYRLAENAFASKAYAKDDTVFKHGSMSQHMYFSLGHLAYTRKDTSYPSDVEAGDWLAEHTLWMDSWICRGMAKATSDTIVIQVDAKLFAEKVQEDANIWSLTTAYAEEFAAWMLDIAPHALDDYFYREEARVRAQAFVAAGLRKIEGEKDGGRSVDSRKTVSHRFRTTIAAVSRR